MLVQPREGFQYRFNDAVSSSSKRVLPSIMNTNKYSLVYGVLAVLKRLARAPE